ncbi:protein FAM72A-like [Ruditapes philippinarum]|uniref:protein FAM72A-like n=1 Tax=Ruditapes philippinarum TaxID=129788 RepID=UPI00295AF38A|nr:protein FAM72A-like [Ruditapes philippinarum]
MAEFDSSEKCINPSFRNEEVYTLDCLYCMNNVCDRGMKSFLIADEQIELYSTDEVDKSCVALTDEKYKADKCKCHIQVMACLQCGNVVGYHVSMPCRPCLQAQNNGHYWMFYRSATVPCPRLNTHGTDTLVWGDLSQCDEDSICDTYWGECER